MSSNIYFDICEDTLVAALERGANLPQEFDVMVTQEMLTALIREGLKDTNGERVPETKTNLTIDAGGHSMTLRVESDEPEETLERTYH